MRELNLVERELLVRSTGGLQSGGRPEGGWTAPPPPAPTGRRDVGGATTPLPPGAASAAAAGGAGPSRETGGDAVSANWRRL